MIKRRIFFFILVWMDYTGSLAQLSSGAGRLTLEKTISMPGVKGRLDHLDVDLVHRVVYVAALGNNSVEVIDLNQGKLIRSIESLDEPQGIGYIPQHEEIFIANGGNGECYFYSSKDFRKIASIRLGSDADDVRYDSAEQKIYVGYGSGGIAIINANNHQLVGEIKLPAHPESFQLDKSLDQLWVNLPDAGTVGVIQLSVARLVNQWKSTGLAANFPMALDEKNHLVFVGFRRPSTLVTMDAKAIKPAASTPMVGDSDDLYFDAQSGQVLASGGEGSISIFSKIPSGQYQQTASIPSRKGARTSLLISQLRLFVVAARAESGQDAALFVYRLGN